jgi:hypothetical protein
MLKFLFFDERFGHLTEIGWKFEKAAFEIEFATKKDLIKNKKAMKNFKAIALPYKKPSVVNLTLF